MYQNKNALSSVESHLLGDNIRNEEAIRPGAVILLSSKRKSKMMLSINCDSEENRISSLKVFQFLLCRRSSILQDIYFLYRIRRFVIFQSSPKIKRMLITRLICIQGKFTAPSQLASSSDH